MQVMTLKERKTALNTVAAQALYAIGQYFHIVKPILKSHKSSIFMWTAAATEEKASTFIDLNAKMYRNPNTERNLVCKRAAKHKIYIVWRKKQQTEKSSIGKLVLLYIADCIGRYRCVGFASISMGRVIFVLTKLDYLLDICMAMQL